MNLYSVEFKRVTYCQWYVEAESKEEAERIAQDRNISDHGSFKQEEEQSYNFTDCVLEQENI